MEKTQKATPFSHFANVTKLEMLDPREFLDAKPRIVQRPAVQQRESSRTFVHLGFVAQTRNVHAGDRLCA